MRYLSRRSRTVHEVRGHLREKGHSSAEIEEAVSRLTGLGYLDDRALVERAAERAVSIRPMGPRRLRLELERRGVERNTIEAGLAASFGPQEEAQALKSAFDRSTRGLAGTPDGRQRRRIAARLARLGFRSGQIRELLEGLGPSEGEGREEEWH